jgi:hypothetical protein
MSKFNRSFAAAGDMQSTFDFSRADDTVRDTETFKKGLLGFTIEAHKGIIENYSLRDQLLFNTPLQKLYEQAYFENFDVGLAIDK